MNVESIKRAYRIREGYWFAPRLFGYGATPVNWQGWVVMLGYVVAMLAMLNWLPGAVPGILVGIALTAAMIVITWRKTDGDWRWRWRWEPNP
ncbi:MFS superfamily sulfate permease-like transporter [Sphingomonas sp. UYAg733]